MYVLPLVFLVFFLTITGYISIKKTKPALLPSVMAGSILEVSFHGFSSAGSKMIPR